MIRLHMTRDRLNLIIRIFAEVFDFGAYVVREKVKTSKGPTNIEYALSEARNEFIKMNSKRRAAFINDFLKYIYNKEIKEIQNGI